ncbi:MAG: ATP-dependent metallopeptidase FtsH/Yme1/Tma family protein, partial [Deferrisomatales bacterium]
PGRFDRQIVIPRPDIKGRDGILKVHVKDVPMAPDVDLWVLARGTPGFSGADLENLVNEAALAAARVNKDSVDMDDFEKAKDKVLMGAERRSLVLSEEERKNTAYHEAGHALVAMRLPNADPIYKVSIIPRGRALGVTQQLPIDERHTYTRAYLMDRIAVFLGGRAAEEIFLGHLTTGAGDDIERATEIARRMVCKWGMSDRLGPLTFGRQEEQIFLGKELASHKDYSEATAIEIDEEIKDVVRSNLERARTILLENRQTLETMAEALLQKEVLGGDDLLEILGGGAPAEPGAAPRPPAAGDPGPDRSRQAELDFGRAGG